MKHVGEYITIKIHQWN